MGTKAFAVRDFLQFLDQDRVQMASLIAQEVLPRLKSPLGLIRAKAEALEQTTENGQKDNAREILDQVGQLEKVLTTLNDFLSVPEEERDFSFFQGMEDLKHFFERRLGKGKIQVLNLIPVDLKVKVALRKAKPLLMSLFLHAVECLEFSCQEPKCLFVQYRKTEKHHVFCFEVSSMGSVDSLNLSVCKSLADSAGWDLRTFNRNSRFEIYIPSSSSDVAKPYSRSLR